MKVTSVSIVASGGNTCDLSLMDPRSQNPFQVKGIDGLDAEEILRRYSGETGGSGSRYYDLTLRQREIVFLAGLNPRWADNESYSDLRDRLYKLIASSRTGEVTIVFSNGATQVAYLKGSIAKIEAPKFSPVQEAKITVDCIYPMLQAMTRTNVDLSPEGVPLDPEDTLIVDDQSNAPHGLKFTMRFTAGASLITIKDETNDWFYTVTPHLGFKTGDILHYSSEYGGKEIYIVRGDDTIYLADVVKRGSSWPRMYPGDNYLKTTAPVVWTSISYVPTYWGV
jgi:hypothetical protein